MTDLQAWEQHARQQIEQAERNAAKIRERLERVQGSSHIPGTLSMTVDATGTIIQLSITPAAMHRDAAYLAAAIKDGQRKAIADANDKRTTVLQKLTAENPRLGEMVDQLGMHGPDQSSASDSEVYEPQLIQGYPEQDRRPW